MDERIVTQTEIPPLPEWAVEIPPPSTAAPKQAEPYNAPPLPDWAQEQFPKQTSVSPLIVEKADEATRQRMAKIEAEQYYNKPIIRPLTAKETVQEQAYQQKEQEKRLKYKPQTIPVNQLEYGWLEKVIDIPGQAITRAINGFLFNAPEFIQKKLTGEGLPEPKSAAAKITGGLGELGGMISGPFSVTGKLISFGKPAKSVVGKVLQSIAKKATTLGAATAASEWSGDGIKENVINRLKAGASGAITGGVFGSADFINMKAFPLTSWILRAGMSSSALDAINKQSPWDDRSLLDKAYSYGLNAYFTRNGISPKTYNTIIEEAKRINTDIEKDGIDYKFPATEEEINNKTEVAPKPELKAEPIVEKPAPIIEKPMVAEAAPTGFVLEVDRKPEGGYRITIPEEKPAPKPLEVTPAKLGTSPERAVKDYIEQAKEKMRQEAFGESVLDEMEYRGESPQNVSKIFWSKTYDTLPNKGKGMIEQYLKKVSGFKPGDTIAIDASGRSVIASSWKEIGLQHDLGNRADLLEGTDRGYVVLMRYANEKSINEPAELVTPVAPPEVPGERAMRLRKKIEVKPAAEGTAEAPIPDVFMRMPLEELKKQADYGVAGAKKAWEIRGKEITETVPPLTEEKVKAAEEAKRLETEAEIVGTIKSTAPAPGRTTKAKIPTTQMTPEQMLLVDKAVEENTIKSKFPQGWTKDDAPTQEANRQALKEHIIEHYKLNAIEKKKNALDPTRLEHYVNSQKTFVQGGQYKSRKARELAVREQAGLPEAQGKEGVPLEIEPTEAEARGEVGPKGKNIIEDSIVKEREAKRQEDLYDLVNRITDEYETTIADTKEKGIFKQWRKLPSDVASKEQERLLKERGIKVSDDTIRKYIGKWQSDLAGKKDRIIDFLKQRDETEAVIDREFIKPEGEVKAGGTLPGRPGEPERPMPKYAGSINLERIDEGVELKDIILKESERWGEFEKSRRKGMTFQETQELADAINKTPEQMTRAFKQRTQELPEYTVHYRDILAKGASDVQKLAMENRTNPSMENEAKFALAFKRFEYILGNAETGTSEIGRTLASFKILSKAKEFQTLKNYKEILKRLGPEGKNADIMRMLSTLDPNDPIAVAKFLRQALKASTKDKLFEVWVNGLLSNPKTWLVNTVSNLITAPAMPLTRTLAGIAELRRGKAREISLLETPAMMRSIPLGIKDGVRRALFAWNNEITMAGISKIETAHYGAIKGKLGKGIRTGGRVLMSTDEFFKGALRMADIYAMATRQAFREKLTGKARAERIADLIKNPTSEMEGHAVGEALYYTFQKELGKYGKWAMRTREDIPALKFVVPFLRTPINIAKFGVEHTPLKLLDIIYKAKTKGLKGTELSMELGKLGLGTLTAIAVAMSVADGDITGAAPINPQERAAFFRQGKKEYAVKIGNNYYGYGRLEPPGTAIGIVADFVSLMLRAKEEERTKIVEYLGTSFYKNISNKTFNTGMINMLDALRDPGRFLPKFVKGLAGSIIPSAVANIASATDPDIRDARTILDKIQSRVPGFALKPLGVKELLPRREVFGKPAKKAGTFLSRLISPVEITAVKNDKIETELQRLKIFPGMPDREIRKHKLTDEQYDHYVQYSGELAYSWIDELMSDPFYKDLSDTSRDKLIRGRINSAREFVRTEMYADLFMEGK